MAINATVAPHAGIIDFSDTGGGGSSLNEYFNTPPSPPLPLGVPWIQIDYNPIAGPVSCFFMGFPMTNNYGSSPITTLMVNTSVGTRETILEAV